MSTALENTSSGTVTASCWKTQSFCQIGFKGVFKGFVKFMPLPFTGLEVENTSPGAYRVKSHRQLYFSPRSNFPAAVLFVIALSFLKLILKLTSDVLDWIVLWNSQSKTVKLVQDH